MVVIVTSQYGAVQAERLRQQIRRTRPTRPTSADNVARRLRDVLRSEIFSGSFAGGLLPREAELMLRYDARRSAVRRALSMLRDEGVVERVQGLGTFAIRDRHIFGLEEMHETTDTATFSPPDPLPCARSLLRDRLRLHRRPAEPRGR